MRHSAKEEPIREESQPPLSTQTATQPTTETNEPAEPDQTTQMAVDTVEPTTADTQGHDNTLVLELNLRTEPRILDILEAE